MSDYTPRRCSKRWLDADCPREVLCIIDCGPKESDRYDVFYTDVQTATYNGHVMEYWLSYICLTESGANYHGEMQAHQVAAYRYRVKHHYITWSSLPEAVKKAVRNDIAWAAEYAKANA